MSLVRNTAGILLTTVAGIPLGLAASVVLARWLSVGDRGLYAVATTFATFAMLLFQLGWPGASIYRLRRAGSSPARVAGAGVLAILVISVLCVAVCVALRVPITKHLLEGAPALVFYLALASVPFELASGVFNGIARGIDRFDLSNWNQFLRRLGLLVVTGVALIVLGGGLAAALLALAAVNAAVALGTGGAVLLRTGIRWDLDREELTDSLRFGLKNYLQSLAGNLHEKVDIFMLAYFLKDPDQVAFYAVAVALITRLRLIPASIATALFPRLAGMEASEAGALTAAVSRHSALWVVLCVVPLGLAGPGLVPLLYGSEYEASVLPFLILLPAMSVLTLYQVLGRYFAALNRQRVNIVTQSASLLLNVGLNLVLIPRYGILGAALASLASYLLEATLIVLAFLRASGRGLGETLVIRRSDLGVYWRRLRPLLARLGREGRSG